MRRFFGDKKESTVSGYMPWILKFKTFIKKRGTLNRDSLSDFLLPLRKTKSSSTVNYAGSAISSAFKSVNIVLNYKSQKHKPVKIKTNVIEKVTKFRNWIAKQSSYLDLVCNFLWETGARIQDLCNLSKDLVNFEEKTVHLVAQKGDERNVSLSDCLIEKIKAELNRENRLNPKYLFHFTDSNAASHFIRRRVESYNKHQPIEEQVDISAHYFRSARISALNKIEGSNITTIAKFIGHRNVATTMKYVKDQDEDVKKLLSKANNSSKD